MSKKFEDTLISIFENLTTLSFRVSFSGHKIFVCGGKVDIKEPVPPSFRDRFFSYTAKNFSIIHESLVLAEDFKDYFKNNAYPDLLVFEEEIANISSLVILFLESPGSLVELGMFCTKENLYKKLVIVAPQEEIQSEDSFIYLGPLENIERKCQGSVFICPWPSASQNEYDDNHLYNLSTSINNKLKNISKSQKFDTKNSGHVAFLIYEIITICFPITISEIELALEAIEVKASYSEVARHLYLLSKLTFIKMYPYGGYKYYHPSDNDTSLIKITSSPSFDRNTVRIKILGSFVMESDDQSRKRQSALKEINRINSGATQ
ncbi:retron St85 family effector protein [Alcanivorax profundi]|uniref:retron St85 family effector protein n=1 Tax=Alcanivorax profundi TaxID=2338368 RepID=UPI0032B30135